MECLFFDNCIYGKEFLSFAIYLNLHNFSIILICIIRSEVFKLLIIIITVLTLGALSVVDGSNDGVADSLQILHLFLKGVLIGILVRVKPVLSFRNGILDS